MVRDSGPSRAFSRWRERLRRRSDERRRPSRCSGTPGYRYRSAYCPCPAVHEPLEGWASCDARCPDEVDQFLARLRLAHTNDSDGCKQRRIDAQVVEQQVPNQQHDIFGSVRRTRARQGQDAGSGREPAAVEPTLTARRGVGRPLGMDVESNQPELHQILEVRRQRTGLQSQRPHLAERMLAIDQEHHGAVTLPQPKRTTAPLAVTEQRLDRCSDSGHRQYEPVAGAERRIDAPGAGAGEACTPGAESISVNSPPAWRQRLHPVTARRNMESIRVSCRPERRR